MQQANIIKGIAVLFMLYHHLLAFPERIPNESALQLESLGWAGIVATYFKVCVPLFFFLSGYAMGIKNDKKLTSYFIRIKTFYKSYCFYFIIWTLIGFIFFSNSIVPGTSILIFDFEPLAYVLGFLALNSTYNPEAWFAEIYIYLLLFTPFLLRISTPYLLSLSFGLFCISFVLMKSNIVFPFTGGIDFFYWQISYVLGILVSRMKDNNWGIKLESNKFIYFIAINIFCLFLGVFIGKNILVFITPVIVLSFVILNIKKSSFLSISLSFFGRLSLPIWLIHPFYCYYFFSGFIYSIPNGLLAYIVLVTLSTFTAYILNKINQLLISNYKKQA